ncbi:MAG: cytochrome C oxidase subunit IV family protein [Sphingobacteriales bacterium]|nr:cytochrome C oxidase subunit IV family protein [Sphingobacteriales bacterium]
MEHQQLSSAEISFAPVHRDDTVGVICILSLAKAFYIVSIFMHLGDEVRNLIMTIVVPLLLFVWFIAAFLWDGDSWRNLRKDYNKGNPAKQEHAAPKPASEGTLK